MRWVVQSTLIKEQCERDLLHVLRERQIPHDVVKVVPFDVRQALKPEPDTTGPVFAYGTTTLIEIAQRRGWRPGVFFDPALTFPIWREHWGELLLNHDAEITTFGALRLSDPRFVRPTADLKLFAGHVIAPARFEEWQEACMRYQTIPETLEIVVAPPRQISAEYRLLVVDGKIPTASRYCKNGRLSTCPGAPTEILEFGLQAIRRWNPLPAYALDVAVTPDGPAVLEMNCINGSGWYAADVGRLVDAVQALEF